MWPGGPHKVSTWSFHFLLTETSDSEKEAPMTLFIFRCFVLFEFDLAVGVGVVHAPVIQPTLQHVTILLLYSLWLVSNII